MSENQDQNPKNNFNNIIPMTWKERLDPADLKKPETKKPQEEEEEPINYDSDEEFEESLRKRVAKKVKQKRKQERVQRRKKLLIMAGAIVLCVILFSLLFRCKNVIIEGNEYYSEEQLLARLVTKRTDKNTLFLYWRLKHLKKGSIPFIESIDVDMEGTHTVKVQVYEKAVIGSVHYMSQYIYFDKDGVVVETASSPKKDVPIISGLQMKSFALFQTMEIEDPDLFTQVLGLSQLIQKYELDIDRIEFDTNKNVTLISDQIEIQLGRRDMYDEPLAELKNLLPAAKGLSGVLNMKDYKPGQGRIILQEKDSEN
ncbi:MAG: hypothetical protein IJ744_08380 [Lachnospiraceae bacterium]|nr:hypothetical protein [Lachnospiraceae bacterium]